MDRKDQEGGQGWEGEKPILEEGAGFHISKKILAGREDTGK